MFIDGGWVDSDEWTTVRNPATEEAVATVALGGVEHANAAVAAAQAAHLRGDWRSMSPNQRADILHATADHLTARLDELVHLEVQEAGATVRQAKAFHVGTAISHLRYFADLARTYNFETAGPISSSPNSPVGIVRREPIGVCAGISPWNFPLLLAVWKIGPALAAGNTLVMKPDSQTPLTLLELARSAHVSGLPAGVLNVVVGPGEVVGSRLAQHPNVRKIAFTGSTGVGRTVMHNAAEDIKRVTLELGGKGPNIVLDDADLDIAVDGALFACWMHAGQACESGTRLLLPDSLHDEFVSRLIERAATLRVGDPLDPATDVGPVVSAKQRNNIEKYIESGIRDGATVAYRATIPTNGTFTKGHWVAPTILTDVRNDMAIARDEIFGPVLSVLRYSSEDEAVAIANDTDYGLSAGVWSRNDARALRIANRLEAGTVWINDWHMIDARYPFGGYKQSGTGRELGPHCLDAYTEEKFIHLNNTTRVRKAYGLLLSSAPVAAP
nr:aldehyde dehydrogenase family protein [Antrihabitans stalactiti]